MRNNAIPLLDPYQIMAPTNDTLSKFKHNRKQVPIYLMDTVDFSTVRSQGPPELEILLTYHCKEDGFICLDLKSVDGRRFLDNHDNH